MVLLRSRMLCWMSLAVLMSANAFAQAGSSVGQVPVRIIVVSSPTEAARILERLKHGDDFAVLAKEKSIDPTADSGGYMGAVNPSSLRPELRAALAGLQPGQLSSLIHIPEGYAIVKVISSNQVLEMEREVQQRKSILSALQAPGAIRYTPNVSGIGETESALFKSVKPPGWGQDLNEVCQTRKHTYANAVKQMELLLADPSEMEKQSPLDVSQEYYALGELYAYPGNMDEAIAQYLKGYELAKARAPEVVPTFDEELGIAYLHRAEMKNSIYDKPGDRCLIPIPAGK